MIPFLVMTALTLSPAEQYRRAEADYQLHGPYVRYLDLNFVADKDLETFEKAQSFWLPHLSRKIPLKFQQATRLPGTLLYRIDLEGLGWDARQQWAEVLKEYPYQKPHPTAGTDYLVIRGDWLLNRTSDASDSLAYYTLLYGAVPANKDEFLKFHAFEEQAARDTLQRTIVPQGRSGVAKLTRLLELYNGPHGTIAETWDSKTSSADADPLQTVPDLPKSDAQELIAPLEKHDSLTGEFCVAQAYFLTDGAGKRVDAADTKVVEDYQKFRKNTSVRTPGSCVGCHPGFNGTRHNELRTLLEKQGELTAEGKDPKRVTALAQLVDQQYLSRIERRISERNVLFATFCEVTTRTAPAQAQAAFRKAAEWYDLPVSTAQAAREVYAHDAQELIFALALYDERHYGDPKHKVRFARLAQLTHNTPIGRQQWEQDYFIAAAALHAWRSRSR